jgi:uncharacterized membrane protein YedE/YeeE
MNFIWQPWPWYVSGPLIGATMLFMLAMGRRFGVSTNLKTLCALGGAGKYSGYFREPWRRQAWNLVFVAGAMLGGALASLWGAKARMVAISPRTVADLEALGIRQSPGMMPEALFGGPAFFSAGPWLLWIAGGFLVGFGARWANGCTSGHAISGLSSLQKGSLLAVTGFFAGGLASTHLLYPWILK